MEVMILIISHKIINVVQTEGGFDGRVTPVSGTQKVQDKTRLGLYRDRVHS